jgi:hypothetical protein
MIEPLRWKDHASESGKALGDLMRYAAQKGPSPEQLQTLTERVMNQLGATPIMNEAGRFAEVRRRWRLFDRNIKSKLLIGVAIAGIGSMAAWMRVREPSEPSAASVVPRPPAVRSPIKKHGDALPTVNEPATLLAAPQIAPKVAIKASNERKLLRRAITIRQVQQAAVPQNDGSNEVAMLQRAKRLIDARPSKAFDVIGEHERRYPDGLFREEREALAIEALSRLHRHDQAAARFEQFVHRYPHSAYRQRIEPWFSKSN